MTMAMRKSGGHRFNLQNVERALVERPCVFPAVTYRFLFGKAGHGGDGARSQVGIAV